MLKLVKNTSNENYPLTPQTSAVRKLTVKGICNTGADLYDSYIVVKNGVSSTVNGSAAVVRNVGWGQVFSQSSIWEYPSTCQVKYATLKVNGVVYEYNEDVNVRVVNMDVYEKNHEKRRKYANLGSCGFQRLESGAKTMEPNPAVTVRSQGLYQSPFVSETVTLVGTNYVKTAAAYREVSSIIYLGDIFKMCDSLDAKQVYLGGKEIEIELQFENYNQILAEVVNYPTDVTTNPAVPRPFLNQTLALSAASVANSDGSQPATVGADLTKIFRIDTVSTYRHVAEVPLFVGQPICLWLQGALPAVVGSNFAQITSISVPEAGGVATIYFKAYVSANGPIRTGGADITAAQFFANIYAGGAGVAVALSCANDPVCVAATNTVYTNIDAGLLSQYTVNGLDLVLVELPTLGQKQNSIKFLQYMRDTDVIPANQLSYNKSFMLDPATVAVHAMFPCKYTAASAQTNIFSVARHMEALPIGANNVSDGLSYRCLINGQQLYSRDIVFGAGDVVEPLYYHRLTLAAQNSALTLNNLSLVAPYLAMNGQSCHAMISEPVEMSAQPQQLNLRLVFTTNATDRSIYVFKAVEKEVSF